jgi:hypothetical protein
MDSTLGKYIIRSDACIGAAGQVTAGNDDITSTTISTDRTGKATSGGQWAEHLSTVQALQPLQHTVAYSHNKRAPVDYSSLDGFLASRSRN